MLHRDVCVCVCIHVDVLAQREGLYLCSYMHDISRAYTPGPPLPRNYCALTGAQLFAPSNTTQQRLHTHTHTRKRQIENAASCILFEPCWRFSWQSAKVGAAQTAAVQGKLQSANLNSLECLFSMRHLDMTPEASVVGELHICVGRARTCACVGTHVQAWWCGRACMKCVGI